jgi:ATP-dependent protease HslVU (ClpYQ) peptidase subunit
MTTIATDGFQIAADGQSTRKDSVTGTNRRKLYPLPDGSFVGAAGRTVDAERAVRVLYEGGNADAPGDYTLMQLHRNGKVDVYEGSLRAVIRMKPPYAIGSGADVAMGALLAGASAHEAVKIAAKIDVYTGGKITSYSR